MEYWNAVVEWFMGLGEQYGVDPIIFGVIYLGAIPFFWVAIVWLVYNLRQGKPVFFPVVAAALCALSAYIYLFIAGENLPMWVYGLVIGLIGYSGYSTMKHVRAKTGSNEREGRMSLSNEAPSRRSNDARYDLVVIGGGAAGLTAAGVGTHLGAKTLLVERDRLGGDCTWHGCVPSKALLKSAKIAHEVKQAGRFGIDASLNAVDFKAVMERVRTLREEIYEEDDHPRNFEEMGIDVRHGQARFIDTHTIEIDGEQGRQRMRGRKFIIAAGASAYMPPIEGLDEVPYLTNETLFEQEEQPVRLAIIGGGPVGTEMAQAFTRLGTNVTVVQSGGNILPRDDRELSDMLKARLIEEGVTYRCHSRATRVLLTVKGAIRLHANTDSGGSHLIEADALLVATGRQANLKGLGLEAAGVEYTERGITVNDRCRTNQKHIYAVGDVTGRYQFTHMSEHMAKTAVTNAILKLPRKIDTSNVPWVIFTDPELGHVGAAETQLIEDGVSFRTYRFPYSMIDRAVTDGETTGLIKVFARSWNGKILGASIFGAHAGELICEYAVAMKNGVTLRSLADTIHPYPTYGLGARRVADQWYVQKQSPRLIRLLQRIFRYNGPVIEPDPNRIV